MRDGIRLGRLFGIRFTVDYSWFLVLILMVANLASVFWRVHPEWHAGSVVVALAAALLFAGSVLAHELGHALVAKSFGVQTREIRLFLFGGVADIEREPPSPVAEALIAVAGPLVSFAIGVASIVFAGFFLRGASFDDPMALLAQLGPLTTIALWLGPVNLMLGAFNLIPGFPLDGGRILRALLWRTTGDLRKATRWASNVGQATGWSFVLMGIAMFLGARIPFFGEGAGSGIWLAFIGWFLKSAAAQSYTTLLVYDALDGVCVADLMRRSGVVIPVDAPVSLAVMELMRTGDHALPVVQGDHLVGILSASDVRRARRDAWHTTAVGAIMTPRAELVTASPFEDASSAFRRLVQRGVEQLPVIAPDGRLVGMLERTTVGRWLDWSLASAAQREAPRAA